MRNNELYHYGIPGMKWGRRKARPSKEARKAKKAAKAKAKREKLRPLVEDNDRRVEQYGKGMVITSNLARAYITNKGYKAIGSTIKHIGAESIRKVRDDPNGGQGKARAIAAATLAGMGATSVLQFKANAAYIRDIGLTLGYDKRHT